MVNIILCFASYEDKNGGIKMIDKQIQNLKQVFFGNHIEQKDLNELKKFLKIQVNTIEKMQGVNNVQLIVYKESKTINGHYLYTCKLVVNSVIIHLKNDTNYYKCIKRINHKNFSFTVYKTNLLQFTYELEKMYNNKIELIKLV